MGGTVPHSAPNKNDCYCEKQRQVVETRDGTNCTKKHKSKKKCTEETMHITVIPDLKEEMYREDNAYSCHP
jgi:hypothetical protein